MRARAVQQEPTDSAALFALGCAAVAAFIALLAFETHPAYLVPVGIAAIPFAASRRQRFTYRACAAALLLAFVVASGSGAGMMFVPSLAALLLSTQRAYTRRRT